MMPRIVLPLMLLLLTSAAIASPPEDRAAALDLLARGVAAFKTGEAATAIQHWSDAARLCRIAGVPRLEAEALVRRGEAYRVTGHFREAAKDLTDALDTARTVGDPYLVAASSGALGNLALLSRRTASAEVLLRDSLSGARRLNELNMAAASSNDLGNLYATTSRPELAVQAYEDARQIALEAGDQTLTAIAEINAVRLPLGMTNQKRTALLRDALDRLARMEPNYQVGLALVAVAAAATIEAKPAVALRDIASRSLERAKAIAGRLDNLVLRSIVSGEAARIALQDGRLDEASVLTQQALLHARQATAPEIAFRWEWQQARIDRALGHTTAALRDYRGSVATLESVRQNFPTDYQDGRSSFRDQFGALYQEFVDLLLRCSRADPDHAAELIREARAISEQMKATELQDYFRDPCVTNFEARQRGIETIAVDTAVIYPIVLPDRLELLVSIGGRDIQVTVPVSELQLRAEVLRFRRLLERRTTNEFFEPAQRLHQMIIGPINGELAGRHIETLVLVPDGILRSVPLAALHDGQHFLIERYAIATVPGLRLVEPQPLSREVRRMLAAGISRGQIGFSPLPNVALELEDIRRLEHSTNLLDSAFLRQRFARELRDVDYTMVHLASHSQIGADPSRSFVLAFDGQLSLDELEASIKLARFRDLGLELLTLSGCQTASGDDRAALGMAGLALKAGARSVLATLWIISDQASGQLAVEFYSQLQNPAFSKARALQAAQRSLIDDPLLSHPAYWAPFLLIGNWL